MSGIYFHAADSVLPIPPMALEWDGSPLSGEEARAGFTARMRLDATSIPNGGTHIQILVSGAKTLTVNRAFIGKASIAGNAWDYEGTPTQILFDSGNASASWVGNGSALSDIMVYDLDPAVAHIIAIERNDAGQNFYASANGKADNSWWFGVGNGDVEAPADPAPGNGKSIILQTLYTGGE